MVLQARIQDFLQGGGVKHQIKVHSVHRIFRAIFFDLGGGVTTPTPPPPTAGVTTPIPPGSAPVLTPPNIANRLKLATIYIFLIRPSRKAPLDYTHTVKTLIGHNFLSKLDSLSF